MDFLLADNEVRLLGCLMEKEMATPNYYPLSLNALTNACNQKSNRNPVVSFDEDTVLEGLDSLQKKRLVRQSNLSRVPKYEQIFSKELNLIAREEAILCILLVRGSQTIGEIRGRTERLYVFASLDEVQEALITLKDMDLVKQLARQPGRKESRYAHLLGGETGEVSQTGSFQPELVTETIEKDGISTAALQEQVNELRQQLQNLQLEFETFKSQFE